jgi:hypothetical protein
MMYRHSVDPATPAHNEDWDGNNAAFTCPKCGKVFVVSAMLHQHGRQCPRCGETRGFVVDSRHGGGDAYLEWTATDAAPPPEDARAFVQKWFWHEGDNLNTRTDFFFICHALLFEAYLGAADSYPAHALAVGLFGLITSSIWFLVGARNDWHIKYMTKAMSRPELVGDLVSGLAQEVTAAREHQPAFIKWAHSVSLFSRVIPFACLDTWLILVLQPWIEVRFAFGIAGVVTGIAALMFRRWPPAEELDRLVEQLVRKLRDRR